MKKKGLENCSIRYVAPEFSFKSVFIKDIRFNDVWKIGLFIFTILTGEEFSK